MSFAVFDAFRRRRVAGSHAQFESPLDAPPEDALRDDLSAGGSEISGQISDARESVPELSKNHAIPAALVEPVEGGIGATVSAIGHADGVAPATGSPEAVTACQLIVAFSAGMSGEVRAAAVRACGGEIESTLRSDADGELVVVKLGNGVAAASAIEALQKTGLVRFAEVDHAIGVQAVSNDNYYTGGSLWGMYGDQTSPVNQYGSQAGEAWAMGYTGSSRTVVGVVDTGIDYTHGDLYLNVWLNQGELPVGMALVDTDADGLITFRDLNNSLNASFVSDINANGRIDAGDLLNDSRWENGIDDDANNYRDDLIGWDFVNNDNDPYDGNGHGTHVSGTIAGMGGNVTGVAGVVWSAQVMGLKFLGDSGSGSTLGAILALDYYTSASVNDKLRGWSSEFIGTNNSWGDGGYSAALLDAIVRGAKQDALFIVAAGNGGADGVGDNNDSVANYPSNYSTLSGAGYEAVIAVAALTSSGGLASYSNYGANTVDIAAPGSGIVSSVNGGGYASYSGTSMATPHVSGALAAYASANPTMTASQLRSALLSNATATTSLTNKVATGGRLNVSAMFEASQPHNGGDDTIIGFATGDKIDGGLGTDRLVLSTQAQATAAGSATDASIVNVEEIDLSGASSGISLNLSAQYDGFTIIGSAYADTITGSAGMDLIQAGAGNDVFLGFTTGDMVDGQEGSDKLILKTQVHAAALAGADDTSIINFEQIDASGASSGVSLNLSVQSDGFTITGGAYADTITGSSGDDSIIGLTSGDKINGGAATDVLVLRTQTQATVLSGATDLAIINLEQIDLSGASSGITLNLSAQSDGFRITGSSYADTITGSVGADVISAGAGNDLFIGFTTGDVIDGNAGTDRLVLKTQAQAEAMASAGDIAISHVEQIDLSGASFGVTLNLSAQSDGFTIVGSAYADAITGSSGDDFISGFTIGDRLDGGSATDSLVAKTLAQAAAVGSAADSAILNVEQIDLSGASSGITLNLSAQSEGFTIIGSAFADTITGSLGADVIKAGTGNDIINDFSAGDMLDGAGGIDKLILKTQAQATAASVAIDDAIIGVDQIDLSAIAGGFTLDLAAQSEGFMIAGSSYADLIMGSRGGDVVIGFTTGDMVDGQEGSDKLVLKTQVHAAALAGADDTSIINFEQIDASGASSGVSLNVSVQSDGFTITGGAYADTITGSSGDDLIIGFTSGDKIDGGSATDVLVLRTQTQATVLSGATDLAIINLEQIDLSGASSGISLNLSAQSDGFRITGSSYADTIAGSVGADVISAGAGNDLFIGFTTGDVIDGDAGTDRLVLKTQAQAEAMASAGDIAISHVEQIDLSGASSGVTLNLSAQSDGFTIVGSAYADAITGSSSADTITGSAGNDTISGGAGNDSITGGAGADSLSGGAGNDVFVYTSLSNSLAASFDTVSDFEAGDCFSIGRLVASNAFSTVSGAANGALAADLGVALTIGNFLANGAALVSLNGGGANAGTYLVINNAYAGFQSSSDAVIKLTNFDGGITSASFF